MVVSMIASLAYGLHLRAVCSPFPNAYTGQVVKAIYLQNRRSNSDLYITRKQWETFWLLFAPALIVWGMGAFLAVFALARRLIGGGPRS